MENSWDHGHPLNFKIQAGFAAQSEHFLKEEPSALLEDWVDDGVHESGVAFALVLSEQDLILDVEVGNVVVEVHILADHEGSDHSLVDTSAEAEVWRGK